VKSFSDSFEKRLKELFYEIAATDNVGIWVIQSMPDDAHGFGSAKKKVNLLDDDDSIKNTSG
jgi:REP element-mobilizing transposase RayT